MTTLSDEAVAEFVHDVRRWAGGIVRSPDFLYHLGRSGLGPAHTGDDPIRMAVVHHWLYMIVSGTLADNNANVKDDTKRAKIEAEMAWPWGAIYNHIGSGYTTAVRNAMPTTWYTTTIQDEDTALTGNDYVLVPVVDTSMSMPSPFSKPRDFDAFIGFLNVYKH